jgi:polyphosphate kinase
MKGIAKWDAYSKARDSMLDKTHTKFAPWTVVKANDKRRLRIGVIRSILEAIPYDGKDAKAVGVRDKKIVGSPKEML